MFKQFRHRSEEPEIIDDFDYQGPDLASTFQTIERINHFLGGNKVLISGIQRVIKLKNWENKPNIKVLDLGSGSGDGLRALSIWAQNMGLSLKIRGIDANPHIVGYAKVSTPQHLNISYNCSNIFDAGFSYQGADLVTCNLFLHHFTDHQIIEQLQLMRKAGVKAVLINDLHRSWLAYFGFWFISHILSATETARLDGLLSVKKGFLRSELTNLAMHSKAHTIEIDWRWAFRYRCILLFDQPDTTNTK